MALRVGSYSFDRVTYDRSSDVMYATSGSLDSARREPSPEGHAWLFDGRDRFHGLALMEPGERLDRDGAVWVTLPNGIRDRVTGIEAAIRGALRASGP